MANSSPSPDDPLLPSDDMKSAPGSCASSELDKQDEASVADINSEAGTVDESSLFLEQTVKVLIEDSSAPEERCPETCIQLQFSDGGKSGSYQTLALPPQSSAISVSHSDTDATRTEMEAFEFEPPPSIYPSSLNIPSLLDSKSSLSDSTSAIIAICRICHMPGEEDEILITPCRCAGTLQFIHNTCLQV